LVGNQIPIGARIVAVADTFDAITSARPYRPARAHKRALDILRQESGRKLDARVVEAFIACYAGRRAVAAWAALCSLPQTVLAAWGTSANPAAKVRISPRRTLPSGATVVGIAAVAIAAPI